MNNDEISNIHLKKYILMEQSPFWEADQGFFRLSKHPKIHYHVYEFATGPYPEPDESSSQSTPSLLAGDKYPNLQPLLTLRDPNLILIFHCLFRSKFDL
jgi:hypothetical protein